MSNVLKALALAVIGALGLWAGWSLAELRFGAEIRQLQKAQLEALVQAEALGTAQGEITITARERWVTALPEIRTRVETKIKEVQVYVPVEARAACIIPLGFIELHNSAVHSDRARETAVSTERAPQSPSGVGLDRVAETIVRNYGKCEETRGQLIALQSWVRAQTELGR